MYLVNPIGKFVIVQPASEAEPTLYYESSAGPGLAKYFTADISDAKIFPSLGSALEVLLQCSRNNLLRIFLLVED